MANSLEERMIGIQESKAAIGKGSMEKLSADEIRTVRLGMFRKIFDLPDSESDDETVFEE
jgi:hypothetical protein